MVKCPIRFYNDTWRHSWKKWLYIISKWKANWIGHILRINCLLQRVIEGKIKGWTEVTGRWGRRRRKLLDDLKERRGYSHLKEEALDRAIWRARFGRGFGPVVRQTSKWMNYQINYTVQKAWRALLFVMCVLQKGNSNMKRVQPTCH